MSETLVLNYQLLRGTKTMTPLASCIYWPFPMQRRSSSSLSNYDWSLYLNFHTDSFLPCPQTGYVSSFLPLYYSDKNYQNLFTGWSLGLSCYRKILDAYFRFLCPIQELVFQISRETTAILLFW